jgi:hypothetical protein
MSLITANSLDVIEAHILQPRVGVWTADLAIDTADALSEGASVSIKAVGGNTYKGTIMPGRSAVFVGMASVRVAAGAGGMSKPATPQYYQGAKVSDIVGGLLNDAGETLASSADQTLLNTVVDSWLVMKQPVSRALTVLLGKLAPGYSWRMLVDGTLWVGRESWPTSSASFEILAQRPADAATEIGTETINVSAGENLPDVGNASHVEHWVKADRVRSIVTCETGTPGDRIKGALLAMAKGAVPGIDYLGYYRCKVVSQSGQKVDLAPDDPRLGQSVTSVPLRHGLPGIEVTITSGCYVRLGWDNGDPRLPFASLWDGGESVPKIVVNATMVYLGAESNAKALATKDDIDNHTHLAGSLSAPTGGGPVTGTTGAPTAPITGTTKLKAV